MVNKPDSDNTESMTVKSKKIVERKALNIDAMDFQITQAIDWGDMDAFQHVNNVVYFRYFENVRIAYFEEIGMNQYMQQHQVGPILGTTECQYLAPLTYPDEVRIYTQVTAIREKRFTMQYFIHSQKLNQLAAQGSGEIVFFDYNLGKTCKIPDVLVSKLAANLN
ncbi:acyl-CoA thioesterase [Aliikangiella maris]|uniref:Thioesterase family protein n=2 Tax=Aliikangiella maris TaxID=3162458 RepID=A0ABV3MIV5_9GAMM